MDTWKMRVAKVVEEARFLVRLWQAQPDLDPPRRGIFGTDVNDAARLIFQWAEQVKEIDDRIRQLKVAIDILDKTGNGQKDG